MTLKPADLLSTPVSPAEIQPIHTFEVDELTVQVYDSPEEVALAGSAIARNILQAAIEKREKATAIFATGRSQVQFLHHLTDPAYSLTWQKITGFHLDEYLGIAAEHPASFRHYLKKHLTGQVNLGEWHSIEGDGLLPLNICRDYEQKLRESLADLCCLGVGNNGHLAFNDPEVADFNDLEWVKVVRLDRQNRQQQVESGAFTNLENVPQYAFTLTLSAIRAVRQSICLAFGEGKSAVVKKMLTDPVDTCCPASFLRQIPQSLFLIDRAAAIQISSR